MYGLTVQTHPHRSSSATSKPTTKRVTNQKHGKSATLDTNPWAVELEELGALWKIFEEHLVSAGVAVVVASLPNKTFQQKTYSYLFVFFLLAYTHEN